MASIIEPPGVLAVTAALFQRLNEAGIRYCHWKSTYRLPDALAGRTDLDVLVDAGDSRRFKQILYEQDFKPFRSSPRRQYPAIEDYLGFDPQSGRLIHLHIHYRMILGEEYLKNYWLPLEQQFLSAAQPRDGVSVPPPELEILVLALRAILKYRDRDVLRDMLGVGRSGGIPSSTLAELRSLAAQTTPEAIGRAAQRCAGVIAPDLVLELLRALEDSPRDGRALHRLRSRARRELRPYQRHGRLQASYIYHRATLGKLPLLRRVLRRLGLVREKQKIPVSGGLTVAFIGADGAGKSTLIQQIARWLSWRVVVHSYYMGTSHPSLITAVLRGVSRTAKLAHAASRRISGERSRVSQATATVQQTLESLRLLSEGRDRYWRYLAGRHKAGQGAIVLYDRYPLDSVRISNRTMDGPRIAAKANGHLRPFSEALAYKEEQLYRGIGLPEHIFALHVSPTTSQSRKPEHSREAIELKSQALAHLVDATPDGCSLTHIDADQPLEQVLHRIKCELWRLL